MSETGILDVKYTLGRVSQGSNVKEHQSIAKSLENFMPSRIYRSGCQTSCQIVRQAFHLPAWNMQPNPDEDEGSGEEDDEDLDEDSLSAKIKARKA